MIHKLSEILAQEKRDQRISMVATAIIVAILIILGIFWSGQFSLMPPPGEEEFELVGAVDFGDGNMGSKDINTKDKAVEDPTPDPAPAKPAPVEQPKTDPVPTPPKPAVDPVVTQTDPSPVSTPKPTPPKPKPTTTTKPNDTKPTTDPDNGEAPQEVKTDPSPNSTPKPGGSNQGDANTGTGNAGIPDAPIDDRFKFNFNPGGGGGGGFRKPISLPYPSYTTQEEATLKFEFVIGPNGRVKSVRLVGLTTQIGLKRAGIDAIRRWRFDPLASNQPQEDKTAQVDITFKLK